MRKFYVWLLVFLLPCPLVWAGESRIDQLRVESQWTDTTPTVTPGDDDAFIKGTLEVDGACRFDAATITLGGIAYTLPTDNGDASEQLQTNGSGVLTWEAAGSGTPTAWDDLTSADADKTHDFTTFYSIFTNANTADDNFSFINTGAFGDISVVKIQQITGNPTNGTMLEVTAADSNVDGIVVSNTTADLDADSTLLTLSLTDNGDANGIFLNCLDNAGAESKFSVAADGNTTIAGTLGVTGAITASAGVSIGAQELTGTTGLINYTNFDVNADGDVTCVDLTASGNVSVGTLKMNALVPSSAAPQAITLDGAGAGGVTIGGTSTGVVAIGGTASAITLGADTTVSDGKNVTIGEGSLTIDNDAINEAALTITSSATTSGNAIAITSSGTTNKIISEVSDDLGTGGMMLYLDSDNIAADNYYLYLYDGAAADFTVSANGATVITGAASTDMLTVTAGDVEITAGDIDLNNGQLMVDTAQDLSNNISRNFAGAGTAAVLVVNDDHASSTNIALDVNQDGTGASTGVRVVHDGDNPALSISAGAARTGDVIGITMANQLAERAIDITGAMTSVAGGGVIEVHATGVIPATAALLRLDADTAQPGDGDGWMANIDDDTLVVATPSKYAVLIDSNANEALHVATGKALFDEAATFTVGLVATGDLNIDFSDNTEEANITAAAADYAADTAILAIVGSAAAGQTNASYLLQLDRNADGDAQDNFIRCRDNGYADTMFSVGSGGVVTATGNIIANGNITGDGATQLEGVIQRVQNHTEADTLTIAESLSTHTNSGAGGAIILSLPEASTAIGVTYTLVVVTAQNLDINPDNGDTILVATNAAGDAIRCATAGDTITLMAVDATNWVVLGQTGTWADVN